VYFCTSKASKLDNGEGAAQILEAQDEQRFTNDGAQFTCFTGTKVQILTIYIGFTGTKVHILTLYVGFTGTKVHILTLYIGEDLAALMQDEYLHFSVFVRLRQYLYFCTSKASKLLYIGEDLAALMQDDFRWTTVRNNIVAGVVNMCSKYMWIRRRGSRCAHAGCVPLDDCAQQHCCR
jgi:hypothetical protein